ncbi:hypothetical protein BDM02DRAFT_3192952 [Thelephora ganbajun]|uniref:Uncharacterized protein n=1 Tax=Thelephora ganbajun TaxID=370292 RepID=A0ACB6YYT7_THEGA|nr:hypothetical protein BDM02DRAFT_3192952 [Thelephora ganbajun]
MLTIICPAKECSKCFNSYKALSCHQHCCKFMPGVVSVVAKHYVEFDGIARAQKRHRMLFSSTAGDKDKQNDTEAVDFETEEPREPSPHPPGDDLNPFCDVPELSGSRPRQVIQLPSRFNDMDMNLHEFGPRLPHLLSYKSQKQQREEAAAEEAMRQAGLPTPTPPPHPITPVELQTIQTEEDEFGQYRPDHNDFTAETCQVNSKDLASGLHMPVLLLSKLPGLVGLFLNATITLLIQWFYSGTLTKSLADVQHLIDDVIMHEDFRAEDLHGINFAQEVKKLDAFESSFEGKGWKESSVKIRVPCPGYECDETEAQEFEVQGVLH